MWRFLRKYLPIAANVANVLMFFLTLAVCLLGK